MGPFDGGFASSSRDPQSFTAQTYHHRHSTTESGSGAFPPLPRSDEGNAPPA